MGYKGASLLENSQKIDNKYFFSKNRFYAGVPKHQQNVQDNKKAQTNKQCNAYKKQQTGVIVPPTLFSIAVGIGQADRTFYRGPSGVCFKIELGHKDKAYRYHLCDIFKDWTWYDFPSEYVKNTGDRRGQPHSYHFQTFKHEAWNPQWNCFFHKGSTVKGYIPGTITKYLCEIGQAYWMFDDGSYNKRSKYITLHTERFTLNDKEAMCEELNRKFGLHSYPMKRSGGYDMIYLPTKDTPTMRNIMHMRPRPYVMHRKVPGGWDTSVNKDFVYSSLKSKILVPNGYESFIKTINNSKLSFLLLLFSRQ